MKKKCYAFFHTVTLYEKFCMYPYRKKSSRVRLENLRNRLLGSQVQYKAQERDVKMTLGMFTGKHSTHSLKKREWDEIARIFMAFCRFFAVSFSTRIFFSFFLFYACVLYAHIQLTYNTFFQKFLFGHFY